MARLIFMRHGRPTLDFDKSSFRWLSANAMASLIKNYEMAALDHPQTPPNETQSLARTASYALVSPLPRAFESFLALRLDIEFLTNRNLSEAPMPLPALPKWLGTLPLPGLAWSIGLRLLWWARLARGDESYSACKNRAHIAAAHLEEAILQHDIVLVAGHGFFNHMLGSVLKRQGWKERPDLVETSVRSGYWSCKILEKTPEPDVT